MGLPASVLSDNGAVFCASARRGSRALATVLAGLGIVFKHSRPYHPQTCGKVERFHQTEKKFLAARAPSRSMAELQARLDRFTEYYNTVRPHRAKKRRPPLAAFSERAKAAPAGLPIRDAGECRIRFDKVSAGKVTLRYQGRLRHLGIGRTHEGKRVVLLVDDRLVQVHSVHGEFLTELELDPSRIYQAQRR